MTDRRAVRTTHGDELAALQACLAGRVPQDIDSVIAAFVAGKVIGDDVWRSMRRHHDTAGEMLLLMRGTSPLAARWETSNGVRVDVLHSVAPHTHAVIATYCRHAGANLGQVTEWQLLNVFRGRTAPP